MEEQNWEAIAFDINYALKNYEGLKQQIVQIKNRAQSYDKNPALEPLLMGEKDKNDKLKFQGLEQLKDRQSRELMRIVKTWPIWEAWLEKIPGVGPFIAGKLISLYYFKLIPICKDCGADLNEDFGCSECGKKAKGGGNLKFRVKLRTFPTISSWWHFMGRHVENGKVPKRQKGVKGDWSNEGRAVGYHIREAFNKFSNGHPYKAYAEKRKRYRLGTHSEATQAHRHNMAWNEAVKLFLSHFWQVAHILDGEALTDPWCVAHGGHDREHIIEPFYWGNHEE